MPSQQIKGQVLFANLAPVPGAVVRIVDHDLSGDDQLLKVSTDANGEFGGRMSEWKDADFATFGDIRVPVPDAMALGFSVSLSGQKHSGPLVLLPGGGVAPIVTPWVPMIKNSVNGKPCSTAEEMRDKIIAAANEGKKITIKLYGEEGKQLAALGTDAKRRELLESKLDPGAFKLMSGAIGLVEAAGLALILIALAMFPIAIGVASVLIAIGVALVIAVGLGYQTVGIRLRTETDTTGRQVTYTELILEK